MNILDKIKLKTEQIVLKTDDVLRNHGVIAGMGLAAAGMIVGIAGVAAMATVAAPGAAVAAPIAAIASIASTGISVLGIPINLAGCAIFGAGFSGIAMSGFSAAYKAIRGVDAFYDSFKGHQTIECIDNNNKSVHMSALKFYELVENGTLKNNFSAVIDPRDSSATTNGNPSQKRTYISDLTLDQASIIQGEPDLEKIQRLLFKEAKDIPFASKLKNKLAQLKNNNQEELTVHKTLKAG